MRHETTAPALTFLNTTIFVAIILFAATSAEARLNVRSFSQTVSASHALSSLSKPQKKRLVAMRRTDTPDGSRFTFTSDSSLDDYSSYVEGTRFFVRVPQAILINVRSNLNGRGFADMRIEQSGDDVILSFRLQQGATVAVNQNFNRLEIIFLTNEQANRNSLGAVAKAEMFQMTLLSTLSLMASGWEGESHCRASEV